MKFKTQSTLEVRFYAKIIEWMAKNLSIISSIID